jgi:hypothetical protein
LSSQSGVIDLIEKACRAGIDTLIVDAKPLSGEVLYRSKYAPRLGEVDGRYYPETFDLLESVIEEGHARGVRVHAAINLFSEGHREWRRGPAYQHPEWQAIMYEAVWTLTFPSGQSVDVELIDPWSEVNEPSIYTRKSGLTHKSQAGKFSIVVQEDRIEQIVMDVGVEIPILECGCILSIPCSSYPAGIDVGSCIALKSKPVFRRSVDSKTPSWGIFVDPVGPAREYELKIIEEIVSGYDIDGIVFDRMRYPGMSADFGDRSRTAFQRWLGIPKFSWPDDVFTLPDLPWRGLNEGRYYKEWLEWRALQIHDFALDAVNLAHSVKPELMACVYVGSWYESYFDVGVNWGSRDFHAGYPWMTSGYNHTGLAELFDCVYTGCYYPLPTRDEARTAGRPEGATVEAGCEISRAAIGAAAPVYGSLYLRDYCGNPNGFRRAVSVCMAKTNGVMLFDLVYLEKYGWWESLREILSDSSLLR